MRRSSLLATPHFCRELQFRAGAPPPPHGAAALWPGRVGGPPPRGQPASGSARSDRPRHPVRHTLPSLSPARPERMGRLDPKGLEGGRGWCPPVAQTRAERRGRLAPHRSRREGAGAHLRLQPEPSGWGATSRIGLEGKRTEAHLRLQPELSCWAPCSALVSKEKGTGATGGSSKN